jgi:hypothetical protein
MRDNPETFLKNFSGMEGTIKTISTTAPKRNPVNNPIELPEKK